jgi:hypothetical protein
LLFCQRAITSLVTFHSPESGFLSSKERLSEALYKTALLGV